MIVLCMFSSIDFLNTLISISNIKTINEYKSTWVKHYTMLFNVLSTVDNSIIELRQNGVVIKAHLYIIETVEISKKPMHSY